MGTTGFETVPLQKVFLEGSSMGAVLEVLYLDLAIYYLGYS